MAAYIGIQTLYPPCTYRRKVSHRILDLFYLFGNLYPAFHGATALPQGGLIIGLKLLIKHSKAIQSQQIFLKKEIKQQSYCW